MTRLRETTPSVTRIEVIGDRTADYALAVELENCEETVWLDPDLLEFVDHAPGLEISLRGIGKKWVRTPGGEWDEKSTAPNTRPTKPWWKFW